MTGSPRYGRSPATGSGSQAQLAREPTLPGQIGFGTEYQNVRNTAAQKASAEAAANQRFHRSSAGIQIQLRYQGNHIPLETMKTTVATTNQAASVRLASRAIQRLAGTYTSTDAATASPPLELHHADVVWPLVRRSDTPRNVPRPIQ